MNKQPFGAAAPARHHPLIVTLHWLIALLIVTEALIGMGILHFWPNTAIKVAPLKLHMILGISMLALMTIQVIARFLLPHPAPARTGSAFLDFIGKATHALLYVFTFLMGGTGILLAVQSHVLQLIFGGGTRFPMVFNLFTHAAVFVLFGLLCSFHVAGALFHQFVLRDRLFARMGYAKVQATEESIRPLGEAVNNP